MERKRESDPGKKREGSREDLGTSSLVLHIVLGMFRHLLIYQNPMKINMETE